MHVNGVNGLILDEAKRRTYIWERASVSSWTWPYAPLLGSVDKETVEGADRDSERGSKSLWLSIIYLV